MTSRAAIRGIRSSGALSKPRESTQLVFDSFIGPASGTVLLANHDSEVDGHDASGVSWVDHPSSAVGAVVRSDNTLCGGSGSTGGTYYQITDPITTAYTVTAKIIATGTSFVGGNDPGICARLDTQATSMYNAALDYNTTSGFNLRLIKYVGGTATVIGTYIISGVGVPPVQGDIYWISLSVSNDEKVVYLQTPADSFLKRVISSGDNSVAQAGRGGVSILRCVNGSPWVIDQFEIRTNGFQLPAGTGGSSTPDPVQSPALLWMPDYSTPTLNVATGQPANPNAGFVSGQIWRTEQESYVRGVQNTDRIQIVANADIPGTGTYKPTGGAIRFENRPFSNAGDFTQLATQDSTATSTSLYVENPTAYHDKDFMANGTTKEIVRVVGTPTGNPITVARGQSTTKQPVTTGDVWGTPAGDVSDSGGAFLASRVEVYDRFASGGGNADPATWPDPVGSIRWYGFSILVPTGFTLDSGTSQWVTLMQWKGQFGGSPPRALELQGSRWSFAGTRARRDLGAINLGVWTRFVVGFRFATDGLNGWSMVYRDGNIVIPKTFEATMDIKSGGADPIYLKDGIYRTKVWTATHITYVGPIKIGTTINDVLNP